MDDQGRPGVACFSRPVPFSRSYWVVAGRFLAGCYPGIEGEDESLLKLKGLVDHGIGHIIDLTEPGEVNWGEGKPFVPYEGRLRPLARAAGREVTIERISIRNYSVPSIEEMSRILDRVDQLIREETPLYLHCWGGLGRTGTVVGCYLARHGFASGPGILELMTKLRQNTSNRDRPSPETEAQTDLVVSWPQGQ